MGELEMNQENFCLSGTSLLSTALLSMVCAQCAVCRCGASAWTVFPRDALGSAPAGPGGGVSQCSEAMMSSPGQVRIQPLW